MLPDWGFLGRPCLRTGEEDHAYPEESGVDQMPREVDASSI